MISDKWKAIISTILVLMALGGLAKIVHGGPLDVGKGNVGKMAVWEVASLTWKPWTLAGYGLVTQLSVGKGEVSRMAYWNGTAWTAWSGTVPSTWLTGGNWKTFYTNGSGVMQELALPAAYYYLQGNGVAAAPTFSNILRPARITTTAGPDTFAATATEPVVFGTRSIYDAGASILAIMGNIRVGSSSYTNNATLSQIGFTSSTTGTGWTLGSVTGTTTCGWLSNGGSKMYKGDSLKATQQISTDSVRLNSLGGVDVRLYNGSGVTMYRGWIVEGSTGSYKKTTYATAGDLMPIGTVFDVSVASQDWYWCTVSGGGYVAVIDAPTATVINGDRVLALSAATNALADCYTLVGVPVHDREVGHPISDGIIGQNTSPATDDLAIGIIHFR